MFGLNFLNPLFLVGLTAAALPILIHLFSRRRAKELPFSSLEFLQEISRQKVRRMRLRQWLLLALRVLIIALFALAMGKPVHRGSGLASRGSSTIAIVLDNSWSMAAADPRLTGETPTAMTVGAADPGATAAGGTGTGASNGGVDDRGTVYALARERALEILDLMAEGDRALLALSGRPVAIPFATSIADAGLLRQEIRRATLSAGRSDLPAALAQVIPLLAGARTMNRELFIVSDFQKHDLDAWREAARDGSGAVAESLAASFSIPEGIIVYLVPARMESMANVSLARLRHEAATTLARGGRLVVTLANHADSPVRERVLRASSALGDRMILGDAVYDLPAGGRDDVAIPLSALPGDGAIEVKSGADALEWDNTGWFVAGDPGARRVLLVTGGSPEEGRFLRTALDPEGTGEFYQVRETTPEGLATEPDWNAQVVILSNVGRLSVPAVENLVRFKARGGGILLGLGDRIDPRYYHTEILPRLSSVELLNIAAEDAPGTFRSLRPLVLAHAIFGGFPIGPGDDLGSARFGKLVTCRTGQEARVLAEFGRSYPAILEEPGFLLFTSSLDGQWNDFVLSASYPPLLHKMVGYLASRGGEEGRVGLVGARLEAMVPESDVEGAVTCVDPLGTRTPVEASPVERTIRLRSQPAPWPGIYRFEDVSGRTLTRFAVNLDATEGDLAVANPESMKGLFGREAKILEPQQEITRELLTGRYGRELWKPLLIMVLLLLGVESLLGRGRLLGG